MPKIAAGATNKNISIAPNGTGKVVVGTGAADATVQSDGNHNLILQTGNSTTSKIEIVDGANGNIDITPNGTGEVDIPKVDIDGGTVDGITLGTNSAVTEAQIDNINIDGNAITSTDTNGNIDLTPAGTGEVNISKVDIDGGAIDATDVTVGSGKTLDVSAGTLTSSTAQKQAIVDGADIEGTAVESTGEGGGTKFLREDGDGTCSWQTASGSDSLPSQTGNADKLLTTNATTASWTNAPINLVKLAFAGQSSPPSTPSAGTLYYSSTTNMLFFWNGTAFIPAGDLASGGIITGYTSGSDYYRVHTFIGTATFIASVTLSADVLIVGGGGGGGSGGGGTGDGAGGGGGGGVIYGTGRVMNAGSYTVTIGGGGATSTIGGNTTVAGLWNGSSGTLTATATGGGSGGNDGVNGGNGGNGGGAGGHGTALTEGSGTQANQLSGTSELTKSGPYNGGDNVAASPYMGGGGGGAGGHGADGSTSGTSVAGGIPMQNAYRTDSNSPYAEGGKGVWTYVGAAGADNTGNGGDGNVTTGLIGGSGIVVIRYTI